MRQKETFLGNLAKELLKRYGTSISDVTVIFPNRRAGLFFEKELSDLLEKPIWAPEIMSMEDFVMSKSVLKEGDQIQLIFELYEVFKTLNTVSESFEKFFFWGEVILKDFSEIDHYLVDPSHIFKVVKSQKELDEAFGSMDEEHKEIITAFWQNFLPEANGTKSGFLKIWNILAPLYSAYKKALADKGIAYKGAIYRSVADSIAELPPDDSIKIFAGYNALTKAEERIIKYYLSDSSPNIYWDLDEYYVMEERQEAGNFIRDHLKDEILSKTIPQKLPNHFQGQQKNITTIAAPLEVSQTKSLGLELKKLLSQPDFTSEKTAIILPHEHLLFPVLNSLPEEIKDINITMGYPMKDTPVFRLILNLTSLWIKSRDKDGKDLLFHKSLMDVLLHPYVHPIHQQQVDELVYVYRRYNTVYIPAEDLVSLNEFFAYVFKRPDEKGFLIYLQEILILVLDSPLSKLEKEFIKQGAQHLQELQLVTKESAGAINLESLKILVSKVLSSIKIPFTGEPLKGLQIMGVLETRNLDFDNIFILSTNEDSFPASAKSPSFIPYNIRKAFSVPTFEQNDAIYAYLFYRLLQRATEVTLYYNTIADFGVSGEKSRFIMQLEQESGLNICSKVLETNINTKEIKEIVIQKEDSVLRRLNCYLANDQHEFKDRLAPTALTTYLDCRLRFYFKYIAKIKEPEELKDQLDPASFGIILHDALETIYKHHKERYKRTFVDKSDFEYINACVKGAIAEAFKKHYHLEQKDIKLEGRNVIAYDILSLFIRKVLEIDESYAPFEIKGLESGSRQGYKIDHPITINNKSVLVGIKGIIDRIDRKDNVVRILDYKTGKDDKVIEGIPSLFDRENEKRNKAGFQTFLYGWLYLNKYPAETDQILAGLFNIRDLFTNDFSPSLSLKIDKVKVELMDIKPYMDDFRIGVTDLLEELFDPDVPFDQTNDEKKCVWCPYNKICQKT